MFKPSEALRRTALMALTCVSLAAAAGVARSNAENAPSVPGQPKALRGTGNLQLSCWQYGRMLFQENQVTLPGDGSQPAVRLNATDRNGRPIYVAETQNATCLLRGMDSASPPVR
jgi:hypothetical protein